MPSVVRPNSRARGRRAALGRLLRRRGVGPAHRGRGVRRSQARERRQARRPRTPSSGCPWRARCSHEDHRCSPPRLREPSGHRCGDRGFRSSRRGSAPRAAAGRPLRAHRRPVGRQIDRHLRLEKVVTAIPGHVSHRAPRSLGSLAQLRLREVVVVAQLQRRRPRRVRGGPPGAVVRGPASTDRSRCWQPRAIRPHTGGRFHR